MKDVEALLKEIHDHLGSKSVYSELRGLIRAGANQLLFHWPHSDPTKLVAMGYCFGGSMVLDIARHPGKGASAGLTFAAVSSIHGTLSPYLQETVAKGGLRTRVQAHHAELDFQGDAGLAAFEVRPGTVADASGNNSRRIS